MKLQTQNDVALQAECLALALSTCAGCDEDGVCLMSNAPCSETLMNNRYSIADGAIQCDYFLTHVLPGDPVLNNVIASIVWQDRDLWSDEDEEDLETRLKQCVDCGRWFMPKTNNQKRCTTCIPAARKKANADSHRRRYWQAK